MNTAEISFIVILAVLGVFYFTIVRPGQQQQKKVQETIRDLQVGDEVITTSGFFARVKEIHTPEQGPVQIVLDLGNGFEVRALTTAVAERVARAGERAEAGAQEEARGA